MDNLIIKNNILKTSYYCQSIYTSIHLFNDLVKGRKYELLNELILKIIEDISNCLNFYSQVNKDVLIINNVNNMLEKIFDGYKNLDYFYVRDILIYEVIDIIENIFENLRNVITEQKIEN